MLIYALLGPLGDITQMYVLSILKCITTADTTQMLSVIFTTLFLLII